MEKIASFLVDHLRLKRGLYVSRTDSLGSGVLTTFDLRMKEPNNEPVMDIPALHTLEHMGATYLRNHPTWKEHTVYFGPMGCRTGFYIVLQGGHTSAEILPLVRELLEWVIEFQGEVPGAAAKDCGNWRDHNLEMAQWEAKKFYKEIILAAGPENLNYPS